MNRLAFAEQDVEQLEQLVQSSRPREYGAFFELRSTATDSGRRLVAASPHFPRDGDWDAQGPHALTPSAKLLSTMVSKAINARSGLLLVHSHPDPRHPTAMSPTDMSALQTLVPVLAELVDGPLAAAVIGPHGWVAILWEAGKWVAIERITSCGRRLRFLGPETLPPATELDDRQQLALGDVQARLSLLDLTIVGAGGIGSPLAETVTRMGVRSATLIDHGALDTPSNVRRVFGATLRDLTAPPKAKAEVLRDHCTAIGLATSIRAVVGDVRTLRELPSVLDADVILCATDDHSSRAVLSAIAYAFHLPLIDAGVRVGRGPSGLEGLPIEIRVCAPALPCLWCRNTLSAERVREENLSEEQRTQLVRDGYAVGEHGPAPSVAASTVAAAGLISCALLGLLDDGGDRLPPGYLIDGLFGDSFVLGASVGSTCICQRQEGAGLDAPLGLR